MRPLILFSLLAIMVCIGVGCSKYAAYERNLTFLNNETLQDEIKVRQQHVDEAKKRYVRIQQTDDDASIEQAEGVLEDAQEQLDIALDEEESRRPSKRTPLSYVRLDD
ncbi:hypothetical protein [Desulfovibrio inopinatus]|uniref:hypothetical protein n=1 Tax=Desulfovibrio inopinatus TaxID=102109 RepID=UPI00041C586D|nr:hypothetical protein [Desulfovibrio inopinatus]